MNHEKTPEKLEFLGRNLIFNFFFDFIQSPWERDDRPDFLYGEKPLPT